MLLRSMTKDNYAFNFNIVNFPLYLVIFQQTLHMVYIYISQLIRISRICLVLYCTVYDSGKARNIESGAPFWAI